MKGGNLGWISSRQGTESPAANPACAKRDPRVPNRERSEEKEETRRRRGVDGRT